MLKAVSINLPDDLIERVQSYANERGTTLTALVRAQLVSLTATEDAVSSDPLLAYSLGLLGRNETIERLELRDYAELLVALGDADLPMPLPPAEQVDEQAETFVALWSNP